MPKYLALIYSDEQAWAALSEEDRSATYARYRAFSERPEVVGGGELQPVTAATSVRVRNDETLVTDGPYAELKEALGGYFVLECESVEQACELAAEIPAAEHGAIEIRPAYVDQSEQQLEEIKNEVVA
jgi:hypothetical protein